MPCGDQTVLTPFAYTPAMFSRRVSNLRLSGIRRIFEMAGKGAINLGLGEPDFQPPPVAIEAMKRAASDGFNKYGSTAGIVELRDAIAEKYSRYGDYTADNVIVTMGSTEGLFISMLTLVDEGEEVLYPDPGFVLYRSHIMLAGGIPVDYGLHGDNFRIDEEELKSRITARTKGIIVNSPSNPTGSVLNEDEVRLITDLAEDHDLIIFSDEAYMAIKYGDIPTFLGRNEKVIFYNTFSKEYAMTGWRIGYMIADRDIIREINKVHYYAIACPPTPLQYGALAAMQEADDYVTMMVGKFRHRRDLIYRRLKAIEGIHPNYPEGAFYIFPRYDMDISSEEFSVGLVERGVLSAPGSAFGKRGEGRIRFSYAASEDDINRAMDVLEEYVEWLMR